MSRIYSVPRNSSCPDPNRTLPSLLEEGCRKHPHPKALNQWLGGKWESLSSQDLLRSGEETALGLLDIGLARQDRVCLFMHSDSAFGTIDMGCLIAGIIDVPIYLTHSPDSILYVLSHAQARGLCVSDEALLQRVTPFLCKLSFTKKVIVARTPQGRPPQRPAGMPDDVELFALSELQERGRARLSQSPDIGERMRREIDPRDIATIIYTSGTTGEPKGVMLSHQNIAFNSLSCFYSTENFEPGQEVVLSFLPLTHVFARMLYYGYLNYGVEVYFTTPDQVSEHLRSVRPTGFATVPHLLEKIYEKIMIRGAQLKGVKKRTFNWAVGLAKRFKVGGFRGPVYSSQLALADKLVFSKWRQALGGRVNGIVSGGAALRPELINFFAAADIQIYQGYGLTESSPTICFNRASTNRPGTVGLPLPGVEIKLARDGEILTRGPHVMHGYYRRPEATRKAVDEEGWLHTGDIGKILRGGYLKVTDRKNSLFKLSTGKFVIPQPLETRLTVEPLVDEAVVAGPGRKYCSAVICPDREALRVFAKLKGLDPDMPFESLLKEPLVLKRFQELIDQTNKGMPPWTTIKRFRLVELEMTPSNGLLTPTLKVRRTKVYERLAQEIDEMYAAEPSREAGGLLSEARA